MFLLGNLGCLNDLIGKALCDVFEVLETLLASILGEEVYGLVHSAEGGDINGLSLNTSTGADTGRVFTSTSVADSIQDDLDRVFAGLELNDFESLAHDPEGFHLFTGVASVEGDASDHSFDEWAQGLSEGAKLIATGSVRDENSGLNSLDSQVVLQCTVEDGEGSIGPFSEELWFCCEGEFSLFSSYAVLVPCFINGFAILGLSFYSSSPSLTLS